MRPRQMYDVSLFIFNQVGVNIYIIIYVHDIIIIISRPSLAIDRLQELQVAFAVKDLGQLGYFLGIDVHHISTTLILIQRKYINDLLLCVVCGQTLFTRWYTSHRRMLHAIIV